MTPEEAETLSDRDLEAAMETFRLRAAELRQELSEATLTLSRLHRESARRERSSCG